MFFLFYYFSNEDRFKEIWKSDWVRLGYFDQASIRCGKSIATTFTCSLIKKLYENQIWMKDDLNYEYMVCIFLNSLFLNIIIYFTKIEKN